MPDGCLDEHAALDYLAGGGDGEAVVAHLDGCAACRALLLALAKLEDPSKASTKPAEPRVEISSGAPTLPAPAALAAPTGVPHRVGRFVILERLGAGAMGVVYRAEDPDLRRPVAIKVMRDTFTGDAARTRMLREAQAMAQLDHPNVIRVYEVGTDSAGDVFIAMEYVAGTTLGRWLRERRPWQVIVDAFVQAGRGLAAAHAVGVVHRDFKPDNAMVDRSGKVKVGDFGLARAASSTDREEHAGSPLAASMTQTGAVIGTPLYMSPEQLEGRPADARGDQFALCVALYDALYGERPFTGADIEELRAATARGPRRPVTFGRAASLWPALRRGLAPAPEDRFPDITALLAAIERAPRAPRRSIMLATAITATIAASATGIVIATRDGDPPDPTAAVWSPQRAATLRDAMQRSQRPAAFVADQANRAIADLDSWIADWRTASAAVDAEVDAGPAITRHRRGCLDRRLRELGLVIDLVANPRGDLVDRVVPSLGALRSPRGCSGAMPSPHTPSPPPGRAERVDELAIEIDLAELRDLAGQASEAAAVIDRLEPELRSLGYAPLLARALYVRGATADDRNEHERAHAAFTEAAALAPTTGDELLEVKILTSLVFDAASSRPDLATARKWLGAAEQAVARARANTALPRDEVDLIEFGLADALATLAHADGDYKAVLGHRERALAMAGRARGERSRVYAAALADLGRALWAIGRESEARAKLEQSIKAQRDVLGPDHPVVAETLVALANFRVARTDFDGARTDFESALAILTASYGADHHKRIPALLGLTNLDNTAGKHADVIRRTTEILALARAAFGDGAKELTSPLILRANAQLNLGDAADARRSLDEATAIDERLHGPNHPRLASNLTMRAMIEMAAGDYRAARAALERMFTIQQKADPAMQAFVAEIDLIEGKRDDALRRFRESTRGLIAEYGEQYPLLSLTIGGEGRALVALGRHREALPLLERADALARKIGADGAQIGAMRLALSRAVFATTKNRARALQLAEAAREELRLQISQPGARPALADAVAWLEFLRR